MADRVKVYRNPDTGEMLARMPGSADFMPIDEAQLKVLQEGGIEAFLRAAGNSIGQLEMGAKVLGRTALGMDPGWRGETLDRLRGEQDLRQAQRPVAGYGGAFAPDAAIGAATGLSGTLGKRMAVTAAVEGGLGAMRNPEDPLTAGAVQGAAGAAMIGAGPALRAGYRAAAPVARKAVHPFTRRVLGSVDDVIEQTGRDAEIPGVYRSRSGVTGFDTPAAQARRASPAGAGGSVGDDAAEAAGGPQAARVGAAGADVTRAPEYTSGQMRGAGAVSADEMVDRWQFPLSKEQAQMVDATDDAAFEAARVADLEAWDRSRTRVSPLSQWKDGKPTDFRALEAQQRRAVRRNLASEIGMPQAQRLDRNMVGENLERISGEINGLIRQSGPLRSRQVVEPWEALLKGNEEGPAGTQLRRWISQAKEKAGKGHTLQAHDAAALRNRISKAMEWAGRQEPDPEALEVFGTARDILDSELRKNWSTQMDMQFEELGYQWKLSQALVRGAKGAISDVGEVNFSTFMNNWRMLDQMVKTGRARDNEFLQFMQTAGITLGNRGRDSGTPGGIAQWAKDFAKDTAAGAMGPFGGLIR